MSRDNVNSHFGPVWQVDWVEKERSTAEDRTEVLISIGSDGRVTQWSIRKGFEGTQLMRIKRPAHLAGSSHTNAKGKSKHMPGSQESASSYNTEALYIPVHCRACLRLLASRLQHVRPVKSCVLHAHVQKTYSRAPPKDRHTNEPTSGIGCQRASLSQYFLYCILTMYTMNFFIHLHFVHRNFPKSILHNIYSP